LIVVRGRSFDRTTFSDRLVDLGELWIETARDSIRLNVSERPQKHEGVSLHVSFVRESLDTVSLNCGWD
jgi:hypothetical protein